MKWIIVSIVVFIVGYTFITLYFRKPGAAYQPYKDSRDRATVQRLKEAGYQRVAAIVESPADPQRTAASLSTGHTATQPFFGGLPTELNDTLVDKPSLPETISSVIAPGSISSLLPYPFQFTCTLADKKNELADTNVYVKDGAIAIVSNFEAIGGELLSRSRESTVHVTLPGGTLQPGDYRVTLIGAKSSRQWTLQVH